MTENTSLTHSIVSSNKINRKEYHREYNSRESTKRRRKELYRARIEHYKRRDRDHYYKNQARHRELQMAKRYKISVEEYRHMFEKQHNLCAICKKPESTKNKVLSVDHCHKTGKVRALLCGKCNKALGFFEDNLYVLSKVKEYIEHHAQIA